MLLSKIHRIGMQLDAMKPVVQQNDIERTQRNSDGGFTLESQRFKTRLRNNGQVRTRQFDNSSHLKAKLTQRREL